MNKGINLRFTVHNILYDIHKNNKNLDHDSIQRKINQHSQKDISFITKEISSIGAIYSAMVRKLRVNHHNL